MSSSIAGDASRRVLVGISGGIAAYKICSVISSLAKAGLAVRVVLTQQGEAFIPPLTVATLARHPAYTDENFWQATQGRPLHIELGEWAELLVIAPLSANTLGKLAHGLADNLLTNTVLASTCPVLLAPAMNTDMWQQQSVQRNWHQLLQDPRYHSIDPGSGVLACDRIGTGRMAEPEDILIHIHSLLHSGGRRDLSGKHLLISTGSTREFLDPVRFIGNPASGKMGVALAQAAIHRGATVTLVHGPMEESLKARLDSIQTVSITTAEEMHRAMLTNLPQANWIVMAAAVADVKPATQASTKLAKADLPTSLPLAQVPDIVADLSQKRSPHQRLIGFAAQTGDIIPPALNKLKRKGLDAIVANPIDVAGSGFGGDRNQAILITKTGDHLPIPPCTKLDLAHQLWAALLKAGF
ncbi:MULTISPECIES: bifunctional phosphopantothenoylcysteine decarboxylase/phosphopantothenate--cysteine ligase CoaBC [Cyanophyceae]|uniref:bifunctional phosphopantothenoylcysteine decarboxylase/phosphopantothenate--cysteine ligase CoaBC n=1 Tax=Cyanophyceae TaxID=3028117 RepID=UPI00168A278C|nr:MULTISPECIES: bifunctional phosphopantothenoylcysteine decarboxylase/phosphopantothenate--cysteine ligase CoaBC [Cyanophyceae]MBD1915814.1 bifunctional phosphopantothenoylcysteine decarboxylase/phosphopantothenate--cysteine ligase CoaBC [Phormidium sp. FACHB-77]MBD2030512.1 bifunctional phosphopantothenoylcysteine decarboxylase/phosphopantothenate--cysteine ligase CoaBC [Phormidium sp. FACHB-322]MBD2053514.1 bifunctional phosphopantothenoylcysteine decarboxylase/phosphopantothenate--cysteine 